jgi:hypothetical protein
VGSFDGNKPEMKSHASVLLMQLIVITQTNHGHWYDPISTLTWIIVFLPYTQDGYGNEFAVPWTIFILEVGC